LDNLVNELFLTDQFRYRLDVDFYLVPSLFNYFYLFREVRPLTRLLRCPWRKDSYLVDSASSHMLVSKIKPCMSKYKQSIL
jgi:hypothetical protein